MNMGPSIFQLVVPAGSNETKLVSLWWAQMTDSPHHVYVLVYGCRSHVRIALYTAMSQ